MSDLWFPCRLVCDHETAWKAIEEAMIWSSTVCKGPLPKTPFLIFVKTASESDSTCILLMPHSPATCKAQAIASASASSGQLVYVLNPLAPRITEAPQVFLRNKPHARTRILALSIAVQFNKTHSRRPPSSITWSSYWNGSLSHNIIVPCVLIP